MGAGDEALEFQGEGFVPEQAAGGGPGGVTSLNSVGQTRTGGEGGVRGRREEVGLQAERSGPEEMGLAISASEGRFQTATPGRPIGRL